MKSDSKFFHDVIRNSKDGATNLYKGALLFHEKKGTTLASSSTFYALITIVPFLLLIVRGIGYFLGNVNQTQKYLFILAGKFFPEVAPQLLLTLQEMIKGPLFAGTQFTTINFLVLAVSAITFLNSIWMGIYFITEDKSILSIWRILKGFVIIGITLTMVMMLFMLPPLIIYFIKMIQTNAVTQFFYENFDFLRPLITFIKKINLRKSYWLKSNLLHVSLLIVYFTVLYRWLFSWKIQLKEAFVAALAFSTSVFVGKSLFWIYIYYVRSGLMRNYGDLYTSVVGVIWLFYLMCFFFYGACVCHVYRQRREQALRRY
ncbi:MAG: YihY/virulence factor BrkB family protein [Bdellovibrionales bacterium]|nr:YihY/virulence factor BrkB family protein [Bdellovibrionales bacterium]